MLQFRRRVILALAASLAFGGTAVAASPEGTWLTESGRTQVKIAPCGGDYCGTITWMQTPAKDAKNPDTSKRGRDLVGTRMLYGLKPDGRTGWKGKLYNFENGKTYTGKMELTGDSTLKLSGCIMGGVICKSQSWKKVQ